MIIRQRAFEVDDLIRVVVVVVASNSVLADLERSSVFDELWLVEQLRSELKVGHAGRYRKFVQD